MPREMWWFTQGHIDNQENSEEKGMGKLQASYFSLQYNFPTVASASALDLYRLFSTQQPGWSL